MNRIVFIFLVFSSTSFGQSLDTSYVKAHLKGEWELVYYLNSDGEQNFLRFGPEENDSSLLIQRVVFADYQLNTSEWLVYKPAEKLEQQGFWYFEYSKDGVFIDAEIEDFFFQGLYEVKSIDSNHLILLECDKQDDCNELYFVRK